MAEDIARQHTAAYSAEGDTAPPLAFGAFPALVVSRMRHQLAKMRFRHATCDRAWCDAAQVQGFAE